VYQLWKKVGLNYFWGDLFDSRFFIAYLIEKNKVKCLVDIGCGAGVLLHFAKSEVKIGLDISLESLKAAQKLDPSLQLIHADSRYMPFRNSFCDTILAMHIISALEKKTDQLKIMNEIIRISKNNTKILITGANRRSKYFKKIYSDEYNENYLHYSEIIKFFKNYCRNEIEGYGPFSREFMFPIKFVYKIPDKVIELLKIDQMIFRLLKSKKYLKDGRSYVIQCTRNNL